ncbi:MAG: SurA N-terminal domain-containing protein [Deltaproteobacteria bacterium]|jgi:peptidyl-prolyl cis-trans isomerase D|nr:SurA N-terminal domain-containing protein [Deltaproteobacteria bacterium]
MLAYIRKNSGGLISIFIIGAIALVFIFWGIGGQDSGSSEDIRINGQPVSQYDYLNMLNNVSEQMRDQKDGNPLTAQEQLVARQQALVSILDRQNLLSLAKGAGRQVSAERINREVKSNPMFQVDGSFSMEAYEELVPSLYNRPLAVFEANLADDIIVNETANFIKGLGFAPVEAVFDEYGFLYDQLVLDYVFFPESAFLDEKAEPTEEQLNAFYNENLDLWRSPAKARLEYVEINITDFNDQVQVSDEDLADAYLEQRETLTRPEEAEASQILVRFPSLSPTVEEKAATEAKAKDAFERAQTEDFKELASQINQDSVSAANNGSLGTVRRGQNLPQVEEAIFGEGKDKIGQVIGPVETIFGYHVLLVESYRPASQATLEESKAELTELVTHRKARRLAVNRVEDLLDILPTSNLTAESFAEIAKSIGLEPQETSLFSDVSNAPPFLAEDESLVAEALETPLGIAGEPLENPERFILYTPIEKLDPFVRPLEDETVRPEAVKAWQANQAKDKALEAAKAFIVSAANMDWDDMVSSLPEGVESETTEPFTRARMDSAGAYLADSDPESLFSQFFKLSQKGDLSEEPIRVNGETNKGYMVLAVNNVQPADISAVSDGEIVNLQATARGAVSNSALNWWQYRSRADAKLQLPPAIQSMLDGNDLEDSQ